MAIRTFLLMYTAYFRSLVKPNWQSHAVGQLFCHRKWQNPRLVCYATFVPPNNISNCSNKNPRANQQKARGSTEHFPIDKKLCHVCGFPQQVQSVGGGNVPDILPCIIAAGVDVQL